MLSGKGVKAQFAIDTGMNRIGLDADDVNFCERIIRQCNNQYELTGIFTHLCVLDTATDESRKFTEQQISKFCNVADRGNDLNLPYVHCYNSAGGLYHGIKDNIGKIIRLGIVLYGLKPDYNNLLPVGIKPAFSWKSVVSMIKKLRPGESVGYGNTFIANREMKIATIPTGYADGYRRELSNKGYVLIKGYKSPIIGRVCMEQMMVAITDIEVKGLNISVGDEVILIGGNEERQITTDYIVALIGTIGYEIVCGISKRVPRLYT